MRNRFNRHPALDHSQRFRQERQAAAHAARDPAVTAMYESQQWRELKAIVRREARGRCEWPQCDRAGCAVDHLTPHKGSPALFFNRGNLWLLCKVHHDRKTGRFDGGFGRAVKPLTFWPMKGPGK
jgi:5-methylcytosine-specific restriction endonuclease McrA